MLGESREKAMKTSGHKDLSQCVEHGPVWMPREAWRSLGLNNWSGDKWNKRSQTNRHNRLSEKDGGVAKHTGGSIPLAAHFKKMVSLYYVLERGTDTV